MDAGERHLSRRQGSQDHAVALQHPGALVLAVADGVSWVDGVPSCAEVGAGLVAELAARAAADGALRGLSFADVRQHVAAALLRQLFPLWATLSPNAGSLLHCTLVLAVTTPAWTAIWRVGDGAWGVTGSLARGRSPSSPAPIACYDGRWSTHGREHQPDSPITVAELCRGGDVDAVARGLEPVLEVEGPALMLYVASDGLRDERAADELLRGNTWHGEQILAALSRPEGCDDLAVAWAHEKARTAT
ncbi:protein phosphatase 2C domain-containing protein [Nannocystis sp. SCPEA4]|uniref:protein phosphatase 2C domain-containing protein n=1 Tax=Nannocystis sp. SCPEA4 TaxID=2996787 RepID=UPI0022721D1F|nr:protein phosphatase 2C domain-containing protein [Nannocystis sp. SCPEA4]